MSVFSPQEINNSRRFMIFRDFLCSVFILRGINGFVLKETSSFSFALEPKSQEKNKFIRSVIWKINGKYILLKK